MLHSHWQAMGIGMLSLQHKACEWLHLPCCIIRGCRIHNQWHKIKLIQRNLRNTKPQCLHGSWLRVIGGNFTEPCPVKTGSSTHLLFLSLETSVYLGETENLCHFLLILYIFYILFSVHFLVLTPFFAATSVAFLYLALHILHAHIT